MRTRVGSVGAVAALVVATVMALVVAMSLSACTTHRPTPAATISPTVKAVAPAPLTPSSRTVNWFDLDVGDCLADPPPVDPNVVAVPVVDCSTPHRAEVFRREPLAVNTAITDVADRMCNEGFTKYTGQPVGSGTFGITYLIDSNQNRTSSNPEPSTVICLLEAADGGVMTVPAQR